MLEVASESTANIDTRAKRDDCAALGIPEYWRFDETSQYQGTKLAGERLVEGRYEPILIVELTDDSLQGYSPALNLNPRWENGQLIWYDPANSRPILTYEDQRERDRADSAETRVQELEEEIHRLRNQ